MRPGLGLFSSFKADLEDLFGGIGDLIQSEITLARVELRQEFRKMGAATVSLALGLLLGVFAAGFVLLAAAYALSLVVAPWLAALIVGVCAALTGGLIARAGWKKMTAVKLKPKETIRSVKENVVWLKSRWK